MSERKKKQVVRWGAVGLVVAALSLFVVSGGSLIGQPGANELLTQTQEQADAKSRGCISCHEGIEPMHASSAVHLGCIDCHGGNNDVAASAGSTMGSPEYDAVKNQAHVQPKFPENWSRNGKRSSANPERSYVDLLKEPVEFVRFINPGDLRASQMACGGCHQKQVNNVPKSTMATASVFWAAAAYANGILGIKQAVLGERYGPGGRAQMIKPVEPLTEEQIRKGARPLLLPMARWEFTQPGEYFRAFERGGLSQINMPPEVGNPNILEEAGKPDIKLSTRGRGTGLRISPAIINIHKTRLNDPHLSFLGTNDHAGDYRSSGCSGCHVVYANDRDVFNSGSYAKYGHRGLSFTADKTIPKDEPGHPIRHRLTRAVPTSMCMSCHMHQPNSFVNTYLGYIMSDLESDAEFLFPEKQKYPTEAEKRTILDHNPEGAAARGLWGDREYLDRISELNPQLKHTQWADYHGHGWVFQAIFKKDRKGYLLDANDKRVDFNDPDKFKKAVHLKDIHLERGMHCADCHFEQDEHGDGLLHGEYGDTIEIECQDCHGRIDRYTNLRTSGPAAPPGGNDLSRGTTPFGRRRFVWRDGKLWQRSMLCENLEWPVRQVKDTVTAGNSDYNERSANAKLIQKGGGMGPANSGKLAHDENRMTCYACHSSWITGCFGCHLPQEANIKSEMQHYEGTETRNYATYNQQVIRSDVYMLMINGDTKGNKVAPARSSSALILSSTNASRQRFYMQQSTISAPGYNGQPINPHVPHTVRSRETQKCTDCHLSEDNNNNAWMAQLLLQGTNFVNFVGRFAYVGTEEAFEAIAVTEFDEPQAVIGSTLHRIAYPDYYKAHKTKFDKELQVMHEHHAHDIRTIQLRGEYLYTAQGKDGMIVYDVANIDNKDFSERVVTAPFSPLGQRTFIRSKYATSLALPTNVPMAPARRTMPENDEQPIHPIYQYAFISDKYEGLILTNVVTLTDGNPSNNFLTRALTYNPDGALTGATNLTVAGNYVYVVADAGLVVVDFSIPLQPKIVATIPEIKKGTAVAVQFRYAFVTDSEGLKVVDITEPTQPRVVAGVAVDDAKNIYVARTYAYIAAGKNGIAIVDIERPDKPFIDQMFNDHGHLNDTHDVKVASTNATTYAYVADGKNGLVVLQLTSTDRTPTYTGFSPRPEPEVIAHRHTHAPALSISKGLDRDRAADESGNQVMVANRIGARPFTADEMKRLYMRDGKIYTVRDDTTPYPERREEPLVCAPTGEVP